MEQLCCPVYNFFIWLPLGLSCNRLILDRCWLSGRNIEVNASAVTLCYLSYLSSFTVLQKLSWTPGWKRNKCFVHKNRKICFCHVVYLLNMFGFNHHHLSCVWVLNTLPTRIILSYWAFFYYIFGPLITSDTNKSLWFMNKAAINN